MTGLNTDPDLVDAGLTLPSTNGSVLLCYITVGLFTQTKICGRFLTHYKLKFYVKTVTNVLLVGLCFRVGDVGMIVFVCFYLIVIIVPTCPGTTSGK